MELEQIAAEAARLNPDRNGISPRTVRPLPGLTLLQRDRPTAFEATLYEPVLCLIAQGRKETTLGQRSYAMGAGQCLLISHDLPVVSRITAAPYSALLLEIDVGTLRSLYDDVAPLTVDLPDARALGVHAASAAVIDAVGRYLALASEPTDAKVLGPAVLREIHYRLLKEPSGAMLRSLVRHDSHASSVARAIALIRGDFRTAIGIPELARKVGMSSSSFHQHFKAITSSTPLQYQKDLRLLAARRLLLAGGASVSTAAYEVGYESPNQFSREYARKFGVAPSKDLAGSGLRSGAPDVDSRAAAASR